MIDVVRQKGMAVDGTQFWTGGSKLHRKERSLIGAAAASDRELVYTLPM